MHKSLFCCSLLFFCEGFLIFLQRPTAQPLLNQASNSRNQIPDLLQLLVFQNQAPKSRNRFLHLSQITARTAEIELPTLPQMKPWTPQINTLTFSKSCPELLKSNFQASPDQATIRSPPKMKFQVREVRVHPALAKPSMTHSKYCSELPCFRCHSRIAQNLCVPTQISAHPKPQPTPPKSSMTCTRSVSTPPCFRCHSEIARHLCDPAKISARPKPPPKAP